MRLAWDPDLLDEDYADDAPLCALYTPDILDDVSRALLVLCIANGARISWTKSAFGYSNAQPTWGISDGFMWLQLGKS